MLLGALLLFAALSWLALRTGIGQRFDNAAMNTVVAGHEAKLTLLSVLGYVSIGAILIVALLCVLLALIRGRVLAGVAALAVLGGANLTTQLLKSSFFERARGPASEGFIVAPNSFPSGHTTVVAAGVGALLIVAPSALRPAVVAAGSFAVTITGASTIVAGWHRPSDVIAALLVTLAWTAAAALVVSGTIDANRMAWLIAPIGAALAGIALVLIGVRPSYGWSGYVIEAAVVLSCIAAATAVSVALMSRLSSR